MPNDSSFAYRSGDLFATKPIRRFLETFLYGSYNDTVYITYWSIMHMLSGIGFAKIVSTWKLTNQPYLAGFIVHTLWELWQVWIGMSKPTRFVGHNNLVDTILDTAFFMIGMWIAFHL